MTSKWIMEVLMVLPDSCTWQHVLRSKCYTKQFKKQKLRTWSWCSQRILRSLIETNAWVWQKRLFLWWHLLQLLRLHCRRLTSLITNMRNAQNALKYLLRPDQRRSRDWRRSNDRAARAVGSWAIEGTVATADVWGIAMARVNVTDMLLVCWHIRVIRV